MSNLEKWLLAAFKPELVKIDNEVQADLKAAEPALEAAAAVEGSNAVQVVAAAAAKAIAARAGIFGVLAESIEPELTAELSSLAASGEARVPALVAGAIAFLQKEEQYL
jgi:hypothetical protein